MIAVGVIGSGAMGSGIAQIAASFGHKVILYDVSEDALTNAKSKLESILSRLVEKEKIDESSKKDILSRIVFSSKLEEMSACMLIVEAIVENPEIKKTLFSNLEKLVSSETIIASNTSSLSISSLSSALKNQERFIGIHFFNPAPLMPLVEIIPGIATHTETTTKAKNIIDSWQKKTVIAKDTPGFIVNRIARPFYGEALRIYEEGIADFATIDWAMKHFGNFRMGPFELMDFIGNDVNYAVTETVFKAFYYDPRYKPSFTQRSLAEAGWLGKKSGRGYYNYNNPVSNPQANQDEKLGKVIFMRILAMLINEAQDALYLNIASAEDIETAMVKGVNYPKGLLSWCEEIGKSEVLKTIENLRETYQEDRYRASLMLKK